MIIVPTQVKLHGKWVSWTRAVLAMRETVAAKVDLSIKRPATEQEYMDAYAEAHKAHFGTEFEVK